MEMQIGFSVKVLSLVLIGSRILEELMVIMFKEPFVVVSYKSSWLYKSTSCLSLLVNVAGISLHHRRTTSKMPARR